MEPVKCSHPACGRYTFTPPKCPAHTLEAFEAVAGSGRASRELLNAESARGIPAVFGGSVRVSERWKASRRPRNVSRAKRREQVKRMREATVVATVGNAERYERMLATVGASGDQNH